MKISKPFIQKDSIIIKHKILYKSMILKYTKSCFNYEKNQIKKIKLINLNKKTNQWIFKIYSNNLADCWSFGSKRVNKSEWTQNREYICDF